MRFETIEGPRIGVNQVITIERFNRAKVAREDVEIVIDVLDPSVSVIDGRIKVTAEQIAALPLLSDAREALLRLVEPAGSGAVAHLGGKLAEVLGTHPDSRAFNTGETPQWTEPKPAWKPDPRTVVGGFFAPGEEGWTRVLIDASGNLSSKLHRPTVIDPSSIAGVAYAPSSGSAADLPSGLALQVPGQAKRAEPSLVPHT